MLSKDTFVGGEETPNLKNVADAAQNFLFHFSTKIGKVNTRNYARIAVRKRLQVSGWIV